MTKIKVLLDKQWKIYYNIKHIRYIILVGFINGDIAMKKICKICEMCCNII